MRTMSIIFRLFWPQILIMIITWVVPGHHEPLPSLTRSLRRWCVARPGVEALWLPSTYGSSYTYIAFHTYWLLRILVIIFSDHHAYWLSHKRMFSSIGSCPIIQSPPRRKKLLIFAEDFRAHISLLMTVQIPTNRPLPKVSQTLTKQSPPILVTTHF